MKKSEIKFGEQHYAYKGSEHEKLVVPESFNYRGMSTKVNCRFPDGKVFALSARSLTPLVEAPAKEKPLNAGHCCHCGGVFKLKRGLMVLHGYERPGHGWINGSCSGVGTVPYEVSPEELPKIRAAVERFRLEQQSFLNRLHSGDVTELTDKVRLWRGDEGYVPGGDNIKMVKVVKGGPLDIPRWTSGRYGKETRFEHLVTVAAANTETMIRAADDDLKRIDEWYAAWKPGMPLLHKD